MTPDEVKRRLNAELDRIERAQEARFAVSDVDGSINDAVRNSRYA